MTSVLTDAKTFSDITKEFGGKWSFVTAPEDPLQISILEERRKAAFKAEEEVRKLVEGKGFKPSKYRPPPYFVEDFGVDIIGWQTDKDGKLFHLVEAKP